MYHWLQGMFTPIVTPFRGNEIDFQAYERLVSWQLDQAADGLVIGSVTGEYSALTGVEGMALVAAARRIAGDDYPILAAIGNYSTADTLAEADAARCAGATALLLRMPYYSRPSQAGLAAHISAVSAATALDIVLDNDPDRCGVEIAVQTLQSLADLHNVIGILERRGDIRRCQKIAEARDSGFMRLTGAADTIPAYLLAGGCGAVTGIGNLVPRWLRRLQAAVRYDDFAQAQILQRRLIPTIDALDAEPEPVLLKHALSRLHPGVLPDCRAPLTAPATASRQRIDAELPRLQLAAACEVLPMAAAGRRLRFA